MFNFHQKGEGPKLVDGIFVNESRWGSGKMFLLHVVNYTDLYNVMYFLL